MNYYKSVRLDHTSHWDKKTLWKEGEIITPDSFDPNPKIDCGHGIHICDTLLATVSYQRKASEYCLVEPIGAQVVHKDKIRCEKVKCIRFLKQEELDELAGFKLWEANHPVNPLLLERDETLDLEKLLREWIALRNSVRDSVWDSVWDSVRNSVWDSVVNSVWYSVWDSVRGSVRGSVRDSVGDSVWDSIFAYMGGLFPNIKEWKYTEELGPDPWRPLLTLWYGGYVPSFNGTTWRLHAGEKADVVFELKKEKRNDNSTHP